MACPEYLRTIRYQTSACRSMGGGLTGNGPPARLPVESPYLVSLAVSWDPSDMLGVFGTLAGENTQTTVADPMLALVPTLEIGSRSLIMHIYDIIVVSAIENLGIAFLLSVECPHPSRR